MHKTLVDRISRRLVLAGVTSAHSTICSVALVTAWFEDRSTSDPQALFRSLAERIGSAAAVSGLRVAVDWLSNPGLTTFQWTALAEALRDLQEGPGGPVDWTAEFAACFGQTRSDPHLGPSLLIARALNRVLDIPLSENCTCVFDGATTIAWSMSGEREVTLLLANHDTAIIVALLARAACRPLDTAFVPQLIDALSRTDPLEGAAVPQRIDHIVSVPPFGMRVRDGEARGMPVETFQIERLAPRAIRSFSTIVPDGVLFREGRQETQARKSMVEAEATTVMSLPSGIFMPSTPLATNLLRLEPRQSIGIARVINARTLDKSVSARPNEQAIARHLEQFQRMQTAEEERSAVVTLDELETSNFSLLPERYLKSPNLDRIEHALRDRPLVSLDDIATIERSKAPLPLRDGEEESAVTAREVAPSDIIEGVVREPKRRLAFDQSQQSALAKVAIKPGDILVSIKGNVGIVGHVNIEADLAVIFDEPWIVSQSLAIIRLKPSGPVASSEVLAAILTAPWVREKLESMSGGSTVRTLPINAVRSLTIPLPTAEQITAASEQLIQVEQLRHAVGELTKNINETRNAIWHSLWQVSPEIGYE